MTLDFLSVSLEKIQQETEAVRPILLFPKSVLEKVAALQTASVRVLRRSSSLTDRRSYRKFKSYEPYSKAPAFPQSLRTVLMKNLPYSQQDGH